MGTRLERFGRLHDLIEETRRHLSLGSKAEAFVYFFLQRILGLDEAAARAAVTHGPLDGGIDAVHIDHGRRRVAGHAYLGAHVVACDFAETVAQSRLPTPAPRLGHLVKTWVAIASSTDDELTLNGALRQRIAALHRYWASVESVEVPHDVYLVTNREHSGIDPPSIEREMNYFTRHFYHYYELADLVDLGARRRPEPSEAGPRDEIRGDEDDGDGEEGSDEEGFREEEADAEEDEHWEDR